MLGQQLVLEVGDDACDPRQAVSVANQMASKGVKLVAGHFCSGSSIPASKVYAEEGILQISPASTNPKFTDEGSWNTFRVCGRDDQQGKVAGKYLADHFKDEKIAILNDNSAYGKGLADETKKALNAAGVKEVMDAAYTPGRARLLRAGQPAEAGGRHRDLCRRLSHRIRADHPPGQGAGDEGHPGRRRCAGDQGVLADRRRCRERHDDDLPGRPAVSARAAAEVVKEFKAKNIDPEGYVLYTYAAIQIWADAVKKAGTADPKKVADALKASGPWQTRAWARSASTRRATPPSPATCFYVWKNGDYAEM